MSKDKIIEFPAKSNGIKVDEFVIRFNKMGIGWNANIVGIAESELEEAVKILENCAYQLRAQVSKD